MNDTLASAMEWIDTHEEEMIDFLSEYVRYRSPTGSEREVQMEFLVPFFRDMGWDDVEVVDVTDDGSRPNVNARLEGSGEGQNLLLNGHCDVVDVSQAERKTHWKTDPWEPMIEDGRLYGRGTSDMKGPLSAMIWAVRGVIESGVDLDSDVFLSVVVGEERAQQDYGAIPATESLLEDAEIPFCVNGEPTNNEIHTKSSSLFNIDIRIQGKAIHASQHNLVRYPQRHGVPHGPDIGVDAIEPMTAMIDRLYAFEHRLNMRHSEEIWGSGGFPEPIDEQGVGTITVLPTIVDAGDYIASIADTARIQGQVYIPPSIDPDDVQMEFEEVVDEVAAANDWLADHPPEISFGGQLGEHREFSYWPAFDVPVGDPGPQALGRAVEAVTGNEPVYSGFKAVSDGGFIQKVCGVDTVSFGPGNTHMGVHGADEYVPLEQVTEAAKVYAAMILEWCCT